MENPVTLASPALCTIETISAHDLKTIKPMPLYGVYLFEGQGQIEVDFISYDFSGYCILFSTPYQVINITATDERIIMVATLRFHGDYYCIEYHKEEVACNGLLFNNIYNTPHIVLNQAAFCEMQLLFSKLQLELKFTGPYARAIAQSYLQLILAICSKTKMESPNRATDILTAATNGRIFIQFKLLLESNYIKERTPAFYASKIGVAVNTLSKQCKTHFNKSPSFLIQQRVVLEAKKLIHLTQMSIKEIAATLNFEDQHYFSRYFKKHTGVSPGSYRKLVGISIVAYLST